MNDAATLIRQFNAGRDPERLAMKLQRMLSDPFVFLRGSCHLFYDRVAKDEALTSVPRTWICGDLHLENFGSFKGDNRLVYFDINDFDEAALAPCTWDLVRLLVSVRLGVQSLSVGASDTDVLCRRCVDAYADALAAGKARWVERETADGLVRELLDGLMDRSRASFLDARTELKGKRRRIRLDGGKALPADDARRAAVEAFMASFSEGQSKPSFFRVLDVARRIAGTGSLGVDRYVILVEGKGSPDGNYLLDLKQALPSCVAPHVGIKQPRWASDAERAVSVQQRMQAVPTAFLHAVDIEGRSYVLRGLQPKEDRVALEQANGKLKRLEELVATMAQLTAWAELRSSGRDGSAVADELIEFGRRTDWRQPLLAAAPRAVNTVTDDWRSFSQAYDQGFFA